jgi:molybdopterin molybdotransferase
MITVKEADTIITENIKKYPSVRVPLQNAFGMVLREDLLADRDLPPFNRVMMDGIGINLSAWEKGIRTFAIEGIQKAGIPALNLQNSDACLEVMTGAVLPQGCDCVIPVEGVEMDGGKAKVKDGLNLNSMQYVHVQASDHKARARLVSKGSRLLAAQVSVAASVGKQEVLVSQMPKIAVVGTGDEVIGIGQKLEPYQIRQSNSYVIQAALELCGYNRVFSFHIRDNEDELKTRLGRMLEDFDVLILSGGVSRGKFDYIPGVLNALGVKELFHRVKQRPGKPLWFGKSKAGKPVFGLPGNPVSTQVGTYRYVLPFLNRSIGLWNVPEEFVSLSGDADVKTDLTYFLPVKVESRQDGRLAGLPVFPNGSGDYAALTKTDGFLELLPETFRFAKGAVARFYRWKT